MRIGILTFHSQLNYGGVVQCWAMKLALEQMGHDVVVIDRWMTPTNEMLDGPIGHLSWRGWLSFMVGSILGCGHGMKILRHWRTRRFVKKLGLTKNHFYNWNELYGCETACHLPSPLWRRWLKKQGPTMLDEIGELDCIVVGSDQVWHGGDWGFPSPAPYLLEGAPKIRAISYAASFGMKQLVDNCNYAEGFKRFESISVREMEGVGLVKSTGYQKNVAHVVDPTLLLNPQTWRSFFPGRKKEKRLVCYFLAEDLIDTQGDIKEWAERNRWTVDIFFRQPIVRVRPRYAVELAKCIISLVCRLLVRPRVRFQNGSGPVEFVRAFSQADAVITDSYHAVMFSAIFKCNMRFIKPTIPRRISMFRRIEEFARECVVGNWLSISVNHALISIKEDSRLIYQEHVIEKKRELSEKWLRNALVVEKC